MIVYSNSCLACTNKPLWKQLRNYAQKNGMVIEQRRTDQNKDYREEARQYDITEPLVMIGDTVYSAYELTEVEATTN